MSEGGKKKSLKDCVTSSFFLPHPVMATNAASDWSVFGLLGVDWLEICRCRASILNINTGEATLLQKLGGCQSDSVGLQLSDHRSYVALAFLAAPNHRFQPSQNPSDLFQPPLHILPFRNVSLNRC